MTAISYNKTTQRFTFHVRINYRDNNTIYSVLIGLLWTLPRSGDGDQPPDMQGRCGCGEQAVADRRQETYEELW
jgi:hypothetical protein